MHKVEAVKPTAVVICSVPRPLSVPILPQVFGRCGQKSVAAMQQCRRTGVKTRQTSIAYRSWLGSLLGCRDCQPALHWMVSEHAKWRLRQVCRPEAAAQQDRAGAGLIRVKEKMWHSRRSMVLQVPEVFMAASV